ncbi:MAG: hypothetical protein J6N81_06460 [Treponema sp.]|nr:hypothetical protein [Treponema sp.]
MTENEFTELYEKANNGDANAQYLIGKEYLLKSLRNEGDFVQSACEWANKSAEQNTQMVYAY